MKNKIDLSMKYIIVEQGGAIDIRITRKMLYVKTL